MSLNIMETNWLDIEQLNKEKTVMFIGFAPIEEHGRHLPLGVDVYETQYWIENSIKKLEQEFKDYTFLTMPVITYGHANMTGFPGNIHISQKLLYQLVISTLMNVIQWGIKHIIIISGHADPKHLIGIEQACEKINSQYGVVSFAPMGAIFCNKVQLENKKQYEAVYDKIQEYPNDFHAGWIETSNMLAIRNELVNQNYKEQPDIAIKNTDMIDSKIVMEKTKGYGHIGYPKEASEDLGKLLNASVAEEIMLCTSCFINRQNYQQYAHHELYNVPYMRLKGDEFDV